MPHAFFHRRSKNHADQAISSSWPYEKRSFRQKLTASRQNHDVAKEFHSASLRPVLIVDVSIHVIGVRKLNQLGGRLERSVTPRLRAKSRRERLFAQFGIRKAEQHELAGVKAHLL